MEMKQFLHSGCINNLDQPITRAKATLSNAKIYFLKSGLMLNSNNTQFLLNGTRVLLSSIPYDMNTDLDGNNLPVSKHVKILGVYFDKYMTLETHMHQLNKKGNTYPNVHKQS